MSKKKLLALAAGVVIVVVTYLVVYDYRDEIPVGDEGPVRGFNSETCQVWHMDPIRPKNVDKYDQDCLDSKNIMWIRTIPIQCGNDWDDYYYENIQKYIDNSTFPTSAEDRLNLTLNIIREFYEQKGAGILDTKIVYDIVPAANCEACGCNAGGHGFYFLVSRDSLDLFEQWHKVSDE